MSEEEVDEQVPAEAEPQVEASEGGEEESSNPIFNALFKAVESDESQEEEEEEFQPPTSLASALHDIDNGDMGEPEPSQPESSSEAVQEAVQEVKPKKRVARKKKIIDPNPTSSQPDFTPEIPAEAKEDISDLTQDEVARYELASWASNNLPEHKGKEKKYLGFFRAHKEYINKRLTEDPDIDLTEDSEYRGFLAQNKIEFNAPEIKEKRIISEARAAAAEEYQPRQAELERKLQALENKPKASEAKQASRKSISASIPQEILTAIKDDPEYTQKFRMESEIVDRVLGDAYSMSDAFQDINHNLAEYDESNPVHAQLAKWIDSEQTAFINSGKTRKEGKTFIRRERFAQVSPNDAGKYYTFTDNDILAILAKRVGESINSQISGQLKRLEQAGFTRQVNQVTQAPVEQVQQQAPAAPRPSLRPGPSAPQAAEGGNQNKVLDLLGL